MNDHHITPFVGSLLAFLSTFASMAEIEIWLKMLSLAVGITAGILGCISALKNLLK